MSANGVVAQFDRHSLHRAWQALDKRFTVLLLLYVPALAAVLWPTLTGLHRRWIDSYTYSHGYLVVMLAAVLVVTQRRREGFAPPVTSGWGLAGLVLSLAAVLVGRASGTLAVAELAVPMALWFGVWTIAGRGNAIRLLWPIGYLYFAIPFWDVLTEPLRRLTTDIVSWWVRISGIPAFIEGNRIHIPSGTFEVAGGCSGLHFVIVGLALAAFYGLMFYRRWRSRLLLGAAALGLALVANWLRVFILVVVGHWSEMQNYLIVEDHYYFGWVLFLAVFAPVVWPARRLERAEASMPPPAAPRPGAAAADPHRAWVLGGTLATLVAALWLGQRIEGAQRQPGGAVAVELPAVTGWRLDGAWTDSRRPHFVGVSGEAAAWYRGDAGRVGVYVAHYAAQRQGREVVFYANRPQGEAVQVLGRSQIVVPDAAGADLPWQELETGSAGGERRLVWFGMRVAGFATSSPVLAKAYQVVGAATGRGDAQAIVLTAACEIRCGSARSALEAFAKRGVRDVLACVRDPGAQGDGGRQERCDAVF